MQVKTTWIQGVWIERKTSTRKLNLEDPSVVHLKRVPIVDKLNRLQFYFCKEEIERLPVMQEYLAHPFVDIKDDGQHWKNFLLREDGTYIGSFCAIRKKTSFKGNDGTLLKIAEEAHLGLLFLSSVWLCWSNQPTILLSRNFNL